MSLKILFLTPWYPDAKIPHHGVFVRDQAGALGKKHQVAVVSSKVDYTSSRIFSWTVAESTFGNIREYRVVVSRSLPFLNQLTYLLASIWVAWKVARAFRPDIIHGNIAYPGGIWSYCLSRLIARPFVISDHTSRFTDNFRSAFHRKVTMFSLRRAKTVIAVSTWAARNIEAALRIPVAVVPNLIHVDEYSISAQPHPPVHIGFLGGLGTDRKGLDVLLQALAPVRRDFVLHVGGGGQLLASYKEMAATLGISEKCVFHGFVDSVPDFMRNVHFFVSSSRMEAFGMVIVEAMASGLPVVTTDSGGPADFMEETCGLLVPPDNIAALRAALEWMIDHFHTYDRDVIRRKAVSRYSPEAFIERIEAIYAGI